MKKCLLILVTVCIALSLTACRNEPPVTTTVTTTAPSDTLPVQATQETEPAAIYQSPLIALAAPVIHQTYTADGTVIFTYSCQDLKLTLEDPQVVSAVTMDFLNRVDQENSAAPKILSAAQAAYTGQSDWVSYSFSTVYDPTRLDRSILSLYGTQVISSGNPRPTVTNVSLSYDLLTGRKLSLKDILSRDYSADVLSGLIADALEPLAAEGVLYSDYAYVISEMFSSNTPVDNWFFSQAGLCFYFAPYEIAPYSAGTVVSEIPYEKLQGLLVDAYFPTEDIQLTGSVTLTHFSDNDLSRFTQFAELILESGEAEYLLHTDGAVSHLRLEQGTWLSDGSFLPENTVFAAATLCATDALMLQTSEETLKSLRLSYTSKGTEVSLPLSELLP